MSDRKIGVILPAYNEAGVIGSVIDEIPRTMKHAGKTYQIVPVVVNDGSADDTAIIAKACKDRPVVIDHILNSGAGAATRTGLYYLKVNNFSYGATMDADGQHATEDLLKVLAAAIDDEADLIIGSRLANTEQMPLVKIIGNKGLNFITRLLLGVSSTDSQSGLKAFNKYAIDTIDYRENGYAFCSEMLWRAQKANLRIKDVPIQAIYTEYSKGKGQSNWNAFHIVKQLVKHRVTDFIHG